MEKSQQIAPDTSEKNLAELIKSGDPTICQQVARHPNASPETLRELFPQFPQAVLSNPAIDLLLLENPNFFTELYTANPNCFNETLPSFYLDWAANHDDFSIRGSIATGIKTPQFILDKLAEDGDLSVVKCVARNPNTSIETLAKLAQHQDSWVRAAVAENKNISLDIMQQLVGDREKRVLDALLDNPKTPLSILEELAKVVTEDGSLTSLAISIGVHPNVRPELKARIYKIYQENSNESTGINFDFNQVKRATDMEMMRIGWTKDIGRSHLMKTYGKRSRLHLTNKQLIEFWKYLSDLPTP